MDTIKIIAHNKSFGGTQFVYSHFSTVTECEMRFAVYLPPQSDTQKLPCLFWLSGLTCTEQNFITKAGAQRIAAELGVILIAPDTSPRLARKPKEQESYDFGEGAGFYVDAVKAPWSRHYRMYSYVTKELYELVLQHFSIDKERIGIFGHSMGGLGALNLALKNPTQYRSVSAFSPICAPLQAPWGIKAFTGYLGEDQTAWHAYDPISLIAEQGWSGSILVDQGTCDEFLTTQLNPELLVDASANAKINLNLRLQEGYDHSYYFIATFIEEHIRFHLTGEIRNINL